MDKINIESLGRRGDGIGHLKGKEIYVPATLAGETVTISGDGVRKQLVEVNTASPLRGTAPCSHFGQCGGCQIQHLKEEAYLEWKHSLVTEPLSRAGILTAVEPITVFEQGKRRKVVFQAENTADGFVFGFSAARSNQIIPITQCIVLEPEIADRLEDISNLARLAIAGKKAARISVLACENGLDVTLQDTAGMSDQIRQKLMTCATDTGFLRLSLDDEILIEHENPKLQIANTTVTPPPGSFVQAVKQAEDTMSDLVAEHLAGCRQVADLYCGIGTFALRLAEGSMVQAVESNQPALDALDQAWRATGGKLRKLNTEKRNLDFRPLAFSELKKTDGLVFDPPRAGAEIQAKQIAKSKVKKVAAVSCNPVTLARDLRILIDGGYKTSRIIPLDQFQYTPHVEVVALLEKV